MYPSSTVYMQQGWRQQNWKYDNDNLEGQVYFDVYSMGVYE